MLYKAGRAEDRNCDWDDERKIVEMLCEEAGVPYVRIDDRDMLDIDCTQQQFRELIEITKEKWKEQREDDEDPDDYEDDEEDEDPDDEDEDPDDYEDDEDDEEDEDPDDEDPDDEDDEEDEDPDDEDPDELGSDYG